MMSFEKYKKDLPLRGRRGILRQEAVMERDFFGWDSFAIRYGLVDGLGMIPEETEARHAHDYDQLLLFIGADPADMMSLGAELEVVLGEEGVRFIVTTPRAIVLPKGTPHFSPIVRKLDRPFFLVTINLTGKLEAKELPGPGPEEGPWSSFMGPYTNLVQELRFMANDPYHYGSERCQPSGGVNLFVGPECGLPVTWAWSTVCLPHHLGPWKEDGLYHPHIHADFDEALMLLSLDPDDLSDLHGRADFCAGPDEAQEHFLLTRSTVMAMPKGTPHLPLTYEVVEKPSVFITMSLKRS